jgi:hypothetical protein
MRYRNYRVFRDELDRSDDPLFFGDREWHIAYETPTDSEEFVVIAKWGCTEQYGGKIKRSDTSAPRWRGLIVTLVNDYHVELAKERQEAIGCIDINEFRFSEFAP